MRDENERKEVAFQPIDALCGGMRTRTLLLFLRHTVQSVSSQEGRGKKGANSITRGPGERIN